MNCKPPTIRHAYLEEYEVAAAIAVKCYQQFENQIAPGLWPVMKDWIVNTTNLKNGGELLIAAKHESIVGSIVGHCWSLLVIVGHCRRLLVIHCVELLQSLYVYHE